MNLILKFVQVSFLGGGAFLIGAVAVKYPWMFLAAIFIAAMMFAARIKSGRAL